MTLQLAVPLALVLAADDPRRIAPQAQPEVVAQPAVTPQAETAPPHAAPPLMPVRVSPAEAPTPPPARCGSRGNRCRDLVVAGAVLAPLGTATLALGSVMFVTGSEDGDRRPTGAVLLAVGSGLVAIAALVLGSGLALHRRQRRASMTAFRALSRLR